MIGAASPQLSYIARVFRRKRGVDGAPVVTLRLRCGR
jgi:hypothetical protein